MRTLLLAGAFQSVLHKYGLDIVNSEIIGAEEVLSFLQQNPPPYEQIVITDQGLLNYDIHSIKALLQSLLMWQEQANKQRPLTLITNNILWRDINMPEVEVCFYHTVRINITQYLNSINRHAAQDEVKPPEQRDESSNAAADKKKAPPPGQTPGSKPKKQSLIERLKKDKTLAAPEISYAEKEFAAISGEISRVIAISGCRGAGVTSTAVNLAHIASQKGLSTMLIDLDVLNCALNLYFSEYYETAEKDRDIAHSLIRNLAKPQDYKLNTYYSANLFVSTLAYSFCDADLLERFFTAAKLVNMLAVFRKHFQLCLLDIPLEVLGKFTESILFIDDFGLCIPNNLYSITGALRSTQHLLTPEERESLFSKAKIIVSKYNNQSTLQEECFSPEKVCELLRELADAPYEQQCELAGFIPYNLDFDTQLETDIPIAATNTQMERSYTDILLRMMKGVR